MRISDWSSDVCSSDLDYWNIKIEQRIAFFSSQQLINIDNGDDPTPMPGAPCSLTRDPNRGNAVVEVHNCFFNQGEVKTDGLDLTLRTNFRSEEHTSELQSLMRISYAVFCLKKKKN